MTATVRHLPTRHDVFTLRTSVDRFVAAKRRAGKSVHTVRAYATALDKLADHLSVDRPLEQITGDQLAEALQDLWGDAAAATWNQRRATVTSWLSWCRKNGHPAPTLPESVETKTVKRDATRAIEAEEIDRALDRPGIPLRAKLLFAMLYETAGRVAEILALDVDDLDTNRRRGRIISKGGDTEWIEWSTRTARLLPRYLKGRTHGPLFLTERSARGSRQPTTADLDPHTGRARLGYDGARDLARTWLGFDLHQFRHSAATHLGEQGIPLQLIMLKTRHKSEKAARIYVQPGLDALTNVTEQLNRSRRRS